MKKLFNLIWHKITEFFGWLWRECRSWQTLLLLAVVCLVVGSPVWVCGLLWLLFHWNWAFVAATALLAFWWLPGTPYFVLCVSITLVIKRIFEKREKKKAIDDTAEKKDAVGGTDQVATNESIKKTTTLEGDT